MVLAAVLALVVFVGGPTVLILNLLPTAIGDYFSNLGQMAARTAATRRRRDGHLARRLDGLLLGLVDLLDAVRRHVHRADQPGPHDPAVRRGCRPHPERREPALVRDLRRRGDQPAAQRHRPRRAPTEEQLFGLLDTMPLGAVLSVIAMLLVAFFVPGRSPRRSSWARSPSAAPSIPVAGGDLQGFGHGCDRRDHARGRRR